MPLNLVDILNFSTFSFCTLAMLPRTTNFMSAVLIALGAGFVGKSGCSSFENDWQFWDLLVPVLLLLIGYIVLRWKKDDMDRSFRFGSRNFGIFAGVFLLLVFIFVFFMSTVPDPTLIMQYLDGTLPQDAANPILTLVYNVLGVVVFMGIDWICWNRYEKKLNQK